MKLDNIEITIQRDYPNGRFVHSINEKSSYIRRSIKKYFQTNIESYLWVAKEYMNTLNKELSSNYSLNDIDELNNDNIIESIIEKIYKYDKGN